MATRFQVGDIVRCVEGKMGSYNRPIAIEGELYEVILFFESSDGDEYVKIKVDWGAAIDESPNLYASRFVLAESVDPINDTPVHRKIRSMERKWNSRKGGDCHAV